MATMPGLVVIDDNELELETMRSAFSKAGLPCLTIDYINDDPDNETGIDHIELDNFIPRIIITDLN